MYCYSFFLGNIIFTSYCLIFLHGLIPALIYVSHCLQGAVLSQVCHLGPADYQAPNPVWWTNKFWSVFTLEFNVVVYLLGSDLAFVLSVYSAPFNLFMESFVPYLFSLALPPTCNIRWLVETAGIFFFKGCGILCLLVIWQSWIIFRFICHHCWFYDSFGRG